LTAPEFGYIIVYLGAEMNYTLIKPNGTEMKFYLRAVAELYQKINGGRIVGVPELKVVDTLAA
jgi:hypothetical protein